MPYELGYIRHAKDEILDPAVRSEHGEVHWTPITLFYDAVGPADVVLLDGHGVRGGGLTHPVEGCAPVRNRRGAGLVGEDLKDAAAEDVLALKRQSRKVSVACRNDL